MRKTNQRLTERLQCRVGKMRYIAPAHGVRAQRKAIAAARDGARMGDRDIAHQGKVPRLYGPGKCGVAAVHVEATAATRRRVAAQVGVAERQFATRLLLRPR